MVWIGGFIVLLIVIGMFSSGEKRCGVCEQSLENKKKTYEWTLEGKKQTLCPNCNSQMERDISKKAFKRRLENRSTENDS